MSARFETPMARCGMTDIINSALAYAKLGHAVFPIASGRKVPHAKLAPHGHKDATSDAEIIEGWRSHNVTAIATVPGRRFAVVDVDVRTDGFTLLHELEKQFGPLPATATVLTPSGGEHRWFSLPEGAEVASRSAAFGAPGVDVKSKGGYVLVPPSLGQGGKYQWDAGTEDIAELPAKWLTALRAPTNRVPFRAC